MSHSVRAEGLGKYIYTPDVTLKFRCPGYDTKLHLLVRLLFRSFKEWCTYWVFIHDLIVWLMLMAFHPILGYFILRSQGVAFTVRSYLYLLWTCFQSFFCTQFDGIRIILNRCIWSTDGTLTGNTTPGQSRPESNGKERSLHTPQCLEQEIHYSMYFRVDQKVMAK